MGEAKNTTRVLFGSMEDLDKRRGDHVIVDGEWPGGVVHHAEFSVAQAEKGSSEAGIAVVFL